MKTFEYTAVDRRGARINGRAWSSSLLALDRELESNGLVLTEAAEATGARRRGKFALKGRDLLTFTTQLATVTAAGVPIVEGLRGIGQRAASPAMRGLMEEMVADLQAGEALSATMERHPKAFPTVYCASVRAGEASGGLDQVLGRLSRYLEWSQSMRATAIQASIYPAILMSAIFGLILILLYFVLPRILSIFPGGLEDLPVQTRLVMGASKFLRTHVVELGVAAAALVSAFLVLRRRPRGRVFLHGLWFRVPKLGAVLAKVATSRFASTASTLQAAGCDVFTVMGIAGATCGNESMADGFRRATEEVRRGKMIADALETEPRVDSLLVQMVAVGEKSGNLDHCLNRLVEYYDEEVPRTVKRFIAVLEPLMLVAAGFLVAFILLAALMPIFKLYESL